MSNTKTTTESTSTDKTSTLVTSESDADAVTANHDAFRKRLCAAIDQRRRKTPHIADDKVIGFVNACLSLRSRPKHPYAADTLRRIKEEGLYQLACGNWDEYYQMVFGDDDRPQDGGQNREDQRSAARRFEEAASAAEPGHPSAADSEPAPAAQKLDVQPASAVAASTSPGAEAGASLTSAVQQSTASASPATIEILYGEFKGIYKVHPAAALFPLLAGQPFEDLKKSIAKHGQKDPAVIDGDVLLDGRNRVRSLNELGRETWAVQFRSLKSGVAPEKWIEIKNAHRRNLSEDQRIAIVARIIAWRKEEDARNRLRCRVTARSNPAASTSLSTSQQPAPGEKQEAAKQSESEYPQKAAENTPKRQHGRPCGGKRSEAKAVAAAASQSRYRAESMIKLADEAPDLTDAVERGELKLKEAMAKLRGRQNPQPTTVLVDQPNGTPDIERVDAACEAASLAWATNLVESLGYEQTQ